MAATIVPTSVIESVLAETKRDISPPVVPVATPTAARRLSWYRGRSVPPPGRKLCTDFKSLTACRPISYCTWYKNRGCQPKGGEVTKLLEIIKLRQALEKVERKEKKLEEALAELGITSIARHAGREERGSRGNPLYDIETLALSQPEAFTKLLARLKEREEQKLFYDGVGAYSTSDYDPMTTSMYDPNTTYMYDPMTTSMYDPNTTYMYDPMTTSMYDPMTTSMYDPTDTYMYDPVTTSDYDGTGDYMYDGDTGYNILKYDPVGTYMYDRNFYTSR